MKLTKTIKEEFVSSVLASVKTPEFAVEIDKAWISMVAAKMPVAVATAYQDARTRDWVSERKVAEIKRELQHMKESGDLSTSQRKAFAEIDGVEEKRMAHQRTLDNIRGAIMEAADSVTTVLGLSKLLPQYAKFLPKGGGRPSKEEAQQALFKLDQGMKALATPAAKPKRVRKAR